MQVMVQVTAVEVDLTDNLEYGFEFAAHDMFGQHSGSISSVNGRDAFREIGFQNGEQEDDGDGNDVNILPASGVNLLLRRTGVNNEFAFVQAVAGETKSELLFCPQILTMNGKKLK